MRSAARAAAGLVLALGVIYALARGHHPAPAAAAPPSTAGGWLLWGAIFPTAGFVALGWAALAYYHRRKMHALHIAEAKLNGFVNVRHSELGDLWRCTECHALILLADIDDHQEESACAAYVRWLGESSAAEGKLDPPEWAAAVVGNHAAAAVPPEHSVTTGDVDTFRELS